MPRKGVVVDFPKTLLAMERVMARTPVLPTNLVLPPPPPPRKPPPPSLARPGASVVVDHRAYPGARELLTDRIDAWARAMPGWRVEQGFMMVDISDALGAPASRLHTALIGSRWWAKEGPGYVLLWLPPWVPDTRGEAVTHGW